MSDRAGSNYGPRGGLQHHLVIGKDGLPTLVFTKDQGEESEPLRRAPADPAPQRRWWQRKR